MNQFSKAFAGLSAIVFMMISCAVYGQSIPVSVPVGDAPKTEFIGGSTEFMYPILRGQPNADTSAYDTIYVSQQAISELSELNLNFLRFPGGTISQYYHATAPNGYGTQSVELDCRPGYITIPGFKQKVRVDGAYPDNMIEQYLSLHRQLEQAQGNSIQTLYVLNIMGHFFNGDLVPVNDILDALIDSYGTGLGVYLDASPGFLTDTLMAQVIVVLNQVYQDPVIEQINQFLIGQDDFQFRVAENIAAINYLVEEEVDIYGVELGNENYAFTMLKDDDLSDIPYDCTTPDSIVQEYGTLQLPLSSYMQAIVKYAMVTSIYDTLINELFDLPTGIVINSTEFNIDALDWETFEINEVKTEKYRYHEMWNRFLGGLSFYDAAIPHIYMKSQPKCESFDVVSLDTLELLGKSYIDFYFREGLPYQFNRIQEEIGQKPLWVTEWNMNTANIFGNTFLQGSYVFQFLNELNRTFGNHQIELLNFHNLAAWRYNQFALLRTDEDSLGFKVIRQSMFEPYMLMGELHRDGHALGTVDMADWLGGDLLPAPDHYFYAYFDETAKQLILHFINQNGTPLDIPISGKQFNVEAAGIVLPENRITAYEVDFIDAESFLSSNEGCADWPQYFDSYTWNTENGTGPAFTVPGWSMGRVKFQLSLPSAVEDHLSRAFSIYPNPSAGWFRVQLDQAHHEANAVKVLDMMGREIARTKWSSDIQINTSEWPDGMYIVLLTDGADKILEARRLVVRNTP